MKLLVVVDKLLTGFDAPPCTYLYIDKSMQDHGLFQAICRTNRLDGEDKDFGYIVDYKDLFKKVENAIAVYTSELDHSAGGADSEVLLQDRLTEGQGAAGQRARGARAAVRAGGAAARASWSTSTTSAATPRSRPTWRSANRSAPRSTRRPSPWCAPTPTSPTSWNRAGYSDADIAPHQAAARPLPERPRDHPQGQRRDARPEAVRGRHAAPDRHLHRGRRAAEDFALRQHGPAGPDREDRHRRTPSPTSSAG